MAMGATGRQPSIEIHLGAGLPPRAADYARRKIAALGREAPLRGARLRLCTARPRMAPVTVHAHLDVAGRPLLTHAVGATFREAVDLAQAELSAQLARLAVLAAARAENVARHPLPALPRLSPAGAVTELHRRRLPCYLFMEHGSGQDSVVWPTGPGNHRLRQLLPRPSVRAGLPPHITLDERAAPAMTERAALRQLDGTGAGMVFFRDRGTGRGGVLYRTGHGLPHLVLPVA